LSPDDAAGLDEGLVAGRETHEHLLWPTDRLHDTFAEARMQHAVAGLVSIVRLVAAWWAAGIGLDGFSALQTRRVCEPASWRRGPFGTARPMAVARAALLALDFGDAAVQDGDHHVPHFAAASTDTKDVRTHACARAGQ